MTASERSVLRVLMFSEHRFFSAVKSRASDSRAKDRAERQKGIKKKKKIYIYRMTNEEKPATRAESLKVALTPVAALNRAHFSRGARAAIYYRHLGRTRGGKSRSAVCRFPRLAIDRSPRRCSGTLPRYRPSFFVPTRCSNSTSATGACGPGHAARCPLRLGRGGGGGRRAVGRKRRQEAGGGR